jgi:prepilin-type N-terminal cleavage/methylation domain-containing protein
MRNLRNSKGFTLIELMIVVVIIGILAAIAIPKFSQVSNNAKEAEAGPVLKQICTLAQTYEDKNGVAATDLTNVATGLVTVGWDDNTNTTSKYYTFSFAGGSASAAADKTGAAGLADYSMNCDTGAAPVRGEVS